MNKNKVDAAIHEKIHEQFGAILQDERVPRLTSLLVQAIMEESHGMSAPAVFMSVGLAAKAISQMMTTGADDDVSGEDSALFAAKLIDYAMMTVKVESIRVTPEEAALFMAKSQGEVH